MINIRVYFLNGEKYLINLFFFSNYSYLIFSNDKLTKFTYKKKSNRNFIFMR